jgi:hypothetical protein
LGKQSRPIQGNVSVQSASSVSSAMQDDKRFGQILPETLLTPDKSGQASDF